MNEITFGKDRYHEIGAMEHWCTEHIGNGCWAYNTPVSWDGLEGKSWVIHSIFGNTTFAFKDKVDFTIFILRWT